MSRFQTAKKSIKNVGFDLKGKKDQTLDSGLDQSVIQQYYKTNKKQTLKPQLIEFRVEKAKEFESYKQIPKFTKPRSAVISPYPNKVTRTPSHVPPSSLQFDGARVNMAIHRTPKKEIPEHLLKPEIDQEKLLKLKAKEQYKKQQAIINASNKKVSLATQKAETALAKAKAEINLKIKRSERNIKELFKEIKKILDQPDDDIILKGSTAIVEQARKAELRGNFVSFIYQVFMESTKQNNFGGNVVNKNQFVQFVKQFQEINEVQATDIFMNILKKLQTLLFMISSPNQSRNEDSIDVSGLFAKDNSDIKKDIQNPLQNLRISTYGMSQSDINNLQLDLSIVDAMYTKWFTEDEDMAGVTDPKVAIKKNKEFREKTKAWIAREEERKAQKKRNQEQSKRLLEYFSKEINTYNIEKERVIECKRQYYDFQEDMNAVRKQSKIINNFLADLPDTGLNSSMKLDELERHLKEKKFQEQARLNFIKDLFTVIKQELIAEQYFVMFFDIPELIIKKQYSRKDYDKIIIKVLQKVKLRYLAQKAKTLDNVPLEKIQITDNDLVPYEVFDDVVTDIERKNSDQMNTIQSFINSCQQAIKTKQEKLNTESDKIRKIAEQVVLAQFINEKMENSNKIYFTKNFIHRKLYTIFGRNQNSVFTNAKEFENAFLQIMRVEQSTNQYNQEYKEKLVVEIDRFNGKVEGQVETKSQMTTATRHTRQSGIPGTQQNRGITNSKTPEKQNEGQTHRTRGFRDSIDDDEDFQLNQKKKSKEEEEAEFQRLRDMAQEDEETKQKKQIDELFSPDPNAPAINRHKKYGIIESKGLIYDNVTTSYPAILPLEHYQKYIMDNLPKKEDGKGQWFIRPHHLESLTKHPNSIKDDVLNINYVSHYNQDYGKKQEVQKSTEAITKIEGHLSELKQRMQKLMMERGEPLDMQDKLYEQMEREAHFEYERFITDKKRNDSKVMIISAYEGVLSDQRKDERQILNRQRKTEYDKNRPPQPGWYQLKGAQFTQELYRNRVALKPNNSNAVYLQQLQDTSLY